MMRNQKAVGSSRPRDEARVFVEGRGCYLDDVVLPGMLHVVFLRSPHAKARIIDVNCGDAASLPGVVRVFTAADLQGVCRTWETSQSYPGLKVRTQSALARHQVLYVGQPVAAVVADSRAVAEDALESIEVEWGPQRGACVLAESLQQGSPSAHDDLADNSAYRAQIGDLKNDAIFDGAHLVIQDEFAFHRLTVCSMETRGVIANYLSSDGSLVVYQSHTAPHQLRSLYAMHLGLDEGRIRVICPHVGGSFGVKIHLYPDEIATVAIARILGQPVKFVADRIEAFVSDIHAREQRVSARLAVDSTGAFLGWDAKSLLAMGPFSTHPGSSVQEGDETVRLAMMPYRVPYISGDLEVVFQNKTIVGQYRGVGHPMAAAIGEYMIDCAAAKLGIAPEDLRMANLLPDDSYPIQSRTGVNLVALSHQKCLKRLLELVDMKTIRTENQKLRESGIFRGIGFAAFVERTATGAPPGAHIRKLTVQDGITLAVDPSGSVRCAISVTDQGQGTHAILAQVIADALGVNPERIRVTSGDSQATPYGSGIRASRGTAVGGELALLAAKELQGRILVVAAALLQMPVEAIDLRDGVISPKAADRPSITLKELAEAVYFQPQLLPPGPQVSLTLSRHMGHDWPSVVPTNGIQASHVEVDVRTGFVKLLRHWAVDDFGVVINPLLLCEQIRGGIAQGIGQALYEELVYSDEGQLTNGTFADYLVPLAADLPDVVVDHVETPWPHTTLGAKGAGEAGTTGALGAVLNAVNDAIRPLGARITEVPMTPTRILAALGKL